MAIQLSTSEVASRLGVSTITVRLWCRRGLFKNARGMPTPRGPVWVIPDTDLEFFKAPKLGRPRKGSAPAAGEPEEKAA